MYKRSEYLYGITQIAPDAQRSLKQTEITRDNNSEKWFKNKRKMSTSRPCYLLIACVKTNEHHLGTGLGVWVTFHDT